MNRGDYPIRTLMQRILPFGEVEDLANAHTITSSDYRDFIKIELIESQGLAPTRIEYELSSDDRVSCITTSRPNCSNIPQWNRFHITTKCQ